MAKTTIVQLMTLLKKKKLTVALAESMTCGLMAHQFCSVKGTSEVLRGGIVCYHPDIKVEVCHVPRSAIEKFTPESQAVTDKLAVNISKLFNADICMAVTGLASSGGSEGPDKPVGTTFLSVYYEDKLHRL